MAAPPIVDQTINEMIEHHPEPFLWLIFRNKKFKVISTKLDKELTIRTRRTDRVLTLRTAKGRRLVHFESQLRYKSSVPERMFVYAGALTAKYKLKVASYVFVVKRSRKVGDIGVYSTDLFDAIANEFRFHVIHAWKLRDAILSGAKEYRVFAPLLLEIEPRPKKDLLQKVKDIISLEKDAQLRGELWSYAIPIASRHFGLKVIRSIFKESDMVNVEWEKMPHFGEVVREKKREAKEEGMQQGMQQGELKGIQGMLIEILNSQFGSLPSKLVRKIQAIDNARQLKMVGKKALRAQSLSEVQAMIKRLSNGANGGQKSSRNGRR